MAKERKSPQEKKLLELTKDHFTYGRLSSRKFPVTWKRKKAHANRVYRRKSDSILAEVTPGMAADDLPASVEELTSTRFEDAIVCKPLQKHGTVTLSEKIQNKIEKRQGQAGRRVRNRDAALKSVTAAVETLTSLQGEQLTSVVKAVGLICTPGPCHERSRMFLSNDPLDQATYFVYRIHTNPSEYREVLRREPELYTALQTWLEAADRILLRDYRATTNKAEQRIATGQRLNALLRASRQSAS
jgi:hypothetical protein